MQQIRDLSVSPEIVAGREDFAEGARPRAQQRARAIWLWICSANVRLSYVAAPEDGRPPLWLRLCRAALYRGFPNLQTARGRAPADLEIGDTAGLETCLRQGVAWPENLRSLRKLSRIVVRVAVLKLNSPSRRLSFPCPHIMKE